MRQPSGVLFCSFIWNLCSSACLFPHYIQNTIPNGLDRNLEVDEPSMFTTTKSQKWPLELYQDANIVLEAASHNVISESRCTF
jgi:hypothetical protein